MPVQSLHLKCTQTPQNNLVHTNKVFHNPSQFPHTKGSLYILLHGKTNPCAFLSEPHEKIEMGALGLNKIHRTVLKVSPLAMIETEVFEPPQHDFLIRTFEIEIDFYNRNVVSDPNIDGPDLQKHILLAFKDQIFTVGQKFVVYFEGNTLLASVNSIEKFETSDLDKKTSPSSNIDAAMLENMGMLVDQSQVSFVKPRGAVIVINNIAQQSTTRDIFQKGMSFQKMGVGGLDKQLGKIFRRAFASRIYPPELISKLGVKHIKGILLYGPPGCGKTLMARQIGKLLDTKEPKIVNGPDILNKYVGQSEENIRNLFLDAEQDYLERGDNADLHLIIFDEIDAICKQRGTVRSGTGVNDSVVNQLLTKIDGVNSLNNVLIIGMTNRLDLIDEALLRPGRFEVQMEIGLPDENGRLQILDIHTTEMKKNGVLDKDVDLKELASRSKNYSGAELEGLVKSAASFALNRHVDIEHLDKTPKDISQKIKVTMYDFERAFTEVPPAFGISNDEFEAFLAQGLIHYGTQFSEIMNTCKSFVTQLKSSQRSNLVSLLLEGAPGSGKTSLAAHLAVESEFPFVKIVSPQLLVGYSENAKCNKLSKVFDDAYKTPLSVIVLDEIERLIDYVSIGPRFSNTVLQALLVLIKKPPPRDRKLLVIGTTSRIGVLKSLEFMNSFNVVLNVPALNSHDDIRNVLISSGAFSQKTTAGKEIIDEVLPIIPSGIPIKKLLLVIEMAVARAEGSEDGRITLNVFRSALRDCGVRMLDETTDDSMYD